MLDWYGGMHIVSPEAYFAARLNQQTQQQDQQQASSSRRLVKWAYLNPQQGRGSCSSKASKMRCFLLRPMTTA